MRATPIAILAAAIGVASAQDKECADGLHMIVARGTGEDEGTGVTGELAERVADKIEGSNIDALEYPATLTDPLYIESVKDGADELREEIRDYVKKCPDSKIAVLGYSQGAHVAGDALCAAAADGFDDEGPLPKDLIEDNVVAIVLLGDPTRTSNATYNKGTAKTEGIFERESVSGCEALSDRIVSYCDTGDIYCDSDAEANRTVHGLYVERYGDAVLDFIVDHWDKDTGGDKGNGGGSKSNPSDTQMPSPTGSGSPSKTDSGSPTNSGNGDSTTETDEPEDAAAGLAPSMGLLALGAVAVLGMM